MKTVVFASPILPGKEQVFTDTLAQLQGDERTEAIRLRDRAGLDREQIYQLDTPMGSMVVLVWDTDDYRKVFRTFAQDTSPHAGWFRNQLGEIHGYTVESLQNPPVIEVVSEWRSPDWTYGTGTGYAVCFPIRPGTREAMRTFATTLQSGDGHWHDDYLELTNAAGISRQMFTLMSTPQGDFALMYGEGTPGWFERAFSRNLTGVSDFNDWWRDTLRSISAVPMFDEDAQPPTSILRGDLKVRTPARV